MVRIVCAGQSYAVDGGIPKLLKNSRTLLYLLRVLMLVVISFISGCASLNDDSALWLDFEKLLSSDYEKVISGMDAKISQLKRSENPKDRQIYLSLLFMKGRIQQYKGKYTEAAKSFEKGFECLDRQRGSLSKDEAILKSQFLYEACYWHLRQGNNEYVYAQTNSLLAAPIIEGNLYSLQYLWIVHLLHTTDYATLSRILKKYEDTLKSQKKKLPNVLNPFFHIEALRDELLVNMFRAYVHIHSGGLESAHKIQQIYEQMENKAYIKVLLFGGQFLGVYKYDRAIVLGLAGYGYALLGKYDRSGFFLEKAMQCLSEKELSQRAHDMENVLLGGLNIAYADAYLIPKKRYADARKSFDKGKSLVESAIREGNILKKIENDNFLSRILIPYLHVVSIKLNYYESRKIKGENYDVYYQNIKNTSIKEAFKVLTPATPKQLIVDMMYISYLFEQSEIKRGKQLDVAYLNELLQSSKNNLKEYAGYEMWKIHYIESVIEQSQGNLDKALDSANKSIEIVETFWNNRFPSIVQQVTFMEDKAIPYHHAIDLILNSKEENNVKIPQLFLYIEKLKTHIMQNGSKPQSSRSEKEGAVNDLNRLQASLSDNEAVLELYSGDDYLISMFISKSNTSLKVNRDKDMGKRVDDFINDTSSDLRKDIENGLALYSKLIGCHGELLNPKVTKIYVIPHRKLNRIPWYALTIDRNGKYLIDTNYILSVVPSAMTLIESKSGGKKGLSHGVDTAIFIGPDKNFDESLLDDLKGLRNLNVYGNENANVDAVKESLTKARNVFIFAHGDFSPRRLDSYISLGGHGRQSRLTLFDIEEMVNVSSKFVFLANCESGILAGYSEQDAFQDPATYPETDDLVGLYKTLFSKGVDYIGLALVKVDTEVTWNFQECLVRRLQAGESEEIAFKSCMQELKKSYSHPIHWGNYILVGK